MMRIFVLLAALLPSSGAAQVCAPREDMVAALTDRHNETQSYGGLDKSRGMALVLEVWVSREKGTYTVLLSRPNGSSCLVAVGTDFFEIIEPVGDPM